jgi:hypothetical protein
LKELGVTVIYDLRSDTEIINYNTPQPEIADIQMRHIPVFKIEDYSPEEMSKYVVIQPPLPSCLRRRSPAFQQALSALL